MSKINMFRKKTDVKEQVRVGQRSIRQGSREVERELAVLQREEQKLVTQIKAAAKRRDEAQTRVLAKSLVRLRQQKTKITQAVGRLKGVGVGLTTAKATHTVASAMKTATGAVQAVGVATDPQKLQKNMQEFAKENERMGLAQEMMEDAVDNAFDTEEVDEETDEIMNQVLDDIGVDVNAQLARAGAPRTRVGTSSQTPVNAAEDEELSKLLASLKS